MEKFSTPKSRKDLIASEQNEHGRAYYIIKNPQNNQYFKLRGLEYQILNSLDGKTQLEKIYQKTKLLFKERELSLEAFLSLIEKLAKDGLLENEISQVKLRSLTFKNFLNYRIALYNPDKMLEKILPYFKFAFNKIFISLSAAAILIGLLIFIFTWKSFKMQIQNLYNIKSLIYLYLSFIIFNIFHEFGHALTCKYFGGKVNETGFLLLYFEPCFYVNVSDAWLFKEKYKKIYIGISGIWVQLFLGALAVILGSLNLSLFFNKLAFLVMTSCGLITLINLNPLIKLDGYYLLSDYIEISNLREKSFNYFKNLFKRKKEEQKEIKDKHQKLAQREDKIYLIYALLSFFYSGFLFFLTIKLIINFILTIKLLKFLR
ncbi:MAG: hypothetical protein HYU63_04870 [Armatimonadetes bacterium]|nr:hypothetical protein [Armatimonadota bacterium]